MDKQTRELYSEYFFSSIAMPFDAEKNKRDYEAWGTFHKQLSEDEQKVAFGYYQEVWKSGFFKMPHV